jgi:hypothetical protein
MYSQELILAGKVKLHGSMAQAKFSHSSLNPIFVYSPIFRASNADGTRIVTYGEVST